MLYSTELLARVVCAGHISLAQGGGDSSGDGGASGREDAERGHTSRNRTMPAPWRNSSRSSTACRCASRRPRRCSLTRSRTCWPTSIFRPNTGVGGGWKVIPDNFLIKVRGDELDISRFREALSRLREIEFWEDDALWAGVAASLPNYRLSKFQPLMPPWVEREVVASYLLDVAGAWRWLSGLDGRLSRVPDGVRSLTHEDDDRIAQLVDRAQLPPLRRDGSRSLLWVRSEPDLREAVSALMSEPVIGLDVETTIGPRALCLIQIAGQRATYMIDTLDVPDLAPLAPLLSSSGTTKVSTTLLSSGRFSGGTGSLLSPSLTLGRCPVVCAEPPLMVVTVSGSSARGNSRPSSTRRSRPETGPNARSRTARSSTRHWTPRCCSSCTTTSRSGATCQLLRRRTAGIFVRNREVLRIDHRRVGSTRASSTNRHKPFARCIWGVGAQCDQARLVKGE